MEVEAVELSRAAFPFVAHSRGVTCVRVVSGGRNWLLSTGKDKTFQWYCTNTGGVRREGEGRRERREGEEGRGEGEEGGVRGWVAGECAMTSTHVT